MSAILSHNQPDGLDQAAECSLVKGLRMVARALLRSEARRVVPWSETLHKAQP